MNEAKNYQRFSTPVFPETETNLNKTLALPQKADKIQNDSGKCESGKEEEILRKVKRLRLQHLQRSNPRRSTVAVSAFQLEQAEKQKSTTKSIYYQDSHVDKGSNIFSGVLLRKQRRDRQKKKRSNNEDEDYTRSRRSSSSGAGIYRRISNRSSTFILESPDVSKMDTDLNESTKSNRKSTSHMKTFLLPSPVNLRLVQQQANQILRRREQERNRDAQEIQRNLDEVEQRIAEVKSVGSDLEQRLHYTPKSEWLLENWLLYGQELAQLQKREKHLNKRVREISTAQEYLRLKEQLNKLTTATSVETVENGSTNLLAIGANFEEERKLMEEMIKVMDQHNQIKKEIQQDIQLKTTDFTTTKTVTQIRKDLADKNFSFHNFDPIFLKN